MMAKPPLTVLKFPVNTSAWTRNGGVAMIKLQQNPSYQTVVETCLVLIQLFSKGLEEWSTMNPNSLPNVDTVNSGRGLWSINFSISNWIRQNPTRFLTDLLCSPKHWLPHTHPCFSFPSERPEPERAPFHVGRVSYILCKAQCKMKFWASCSKSRKKVKKCHGRYWNIKLFFHSLSFDSPWIF